MTGLLARVVARFDEGAHPTGGGILALTIADYVAYYREKRESPRRLALLFVPRVAHNPSLHATILIRLAIMSPAFTLGLWRTLLIAKHAIDVQNGITIGPGLVLMHPHSLTLGWGVTIGRNVTIMHNVTIGGVARPPKDATRLSPIIQDDVVIYTGSLVIGPITVGEGAVIGAGSLVDRDVPAGEVHRGRTQFVRDRDLAADRGE